MLFDEASLGRQLVRGPVPEALRPSALEQRQRLIETLAEHDDPLMEQYVEGQPITLLEIQGALRRRHL